MNSEDQRFKVVINPKGQFSIWPVDDVLPNGWRTDDACSEHSKQACFNYIKSTWTDLQPVVAVKGREGGETLSANCPERVYEGEVQAWEAQARSIPELLQLQLSQRQDDIAVEDEVTKLTFKQLDEQANALAAWLQSKGVVPADVIGVSAEPSAELIIAVLAIFKVGAVYLPLDPFYPEERLKFILEDAAPAMLLVQAGVEGAIFNTDVPVHACLQPGMSSWLESRLEIQAYFQATEIEAEHLAYIIYTSGSSGRPKGTLLTHSGLVNLVLAQKEAFFIDQGQRVLLFSSINFDVSVADIFISLSSGARLCLAPKSKLLVGKALQNTLRDRHIQTVTLPPAVLPLMDCDSLPELETLIVAGEACSRELVQVWARGRRMINAYGPTEATVYASHQLCSLSEAAPPAIGKAVDNTRLYILDEKRNQLGVGKTGELFISGPGLALGYLGRPDMTAEKFIPDPFSETGGERMYRTGDLARYRPDGSIEFCGRIDDQVKIRGVRVELDDIASHIRQHRDVDDALVLAKHDLSGEMCIVAYVIQKNANPGQSVTWSALNDYLSEHLPYYMLPNYCLVLPSFPYTPNGKVDRKALPDPDWVGVAVNYCAPRDEIESQICEVWADALTLVKVGIKDNIFQLGAHSLALARAIVKLDSAFSVVLSISDIYRAPTVEELANTVRTMASSKQCQTQTVDNAWEQVSQNLTKSASDGQQRIKYLLIPGAGGGVETVYPIAEELIKSGASAYIVQHDGVVNDEQPSESIVEMAEDYTTQLERVLSADTPVVIIGYCMGGTIGLEVSRQLRKRGFVDTRLVFLDTGFPVEKGKDIHVDKVTFQGLFFAAMCNAYLQNVVPLSPTFFSEMSLDDCIQHTLEKMSLNREAEESKAEKYLRSRFTAEWAHIYADNEYWKSDLGNAQGSGIARVGDTATRTLVVASDEYASNPEIDIRAAEAQGCSLSNVLCFPGEHRDLMTDHSKGIVLSILRDL